MTEIDFYWIDIDTDDPIAVSQTLDGMACSLKADGWYDDATRLHVAEQCIRGLAEENTNLKAENEALRAAAREFHYATQAGGAGTVGVLVHPHSVARVDRADEALQKALAAHDKEGK